MGNTRIKKNDMVLVISGKDRDLTTPRRVLQVMPAAGRARVEGAGMVKRHTRPNPQRNVKGGILQREASIHLSNLMPVDPDTKRPTRVRSKRLEDGKRVRVAARSGAMLDK
jgi:large subunit ribosomal protein L24